MTRIDLRAGNEVEILAALANRLGDSIGPNLRRAVSSAIFGPNHLEIILPARYDFAKKACERPEVQSRIEDVLGEITGQPVTVRFRLESVSTTTNPAKPIAEPKIKPVVAPEDQLVKEVAEKFGIEGWRVHELASLAADDSSAQE
jgi:hypothetical protein